MSAAELIRCVRKRQESIPVGVALRIAVDAAAGLDAAHGLRDDGGHPLELVHRDVSPQNLLIGVEGSTRVADFGVARALSHVTPSRAGQLKGKLGYAAPEQITGDVMGPATDLFAWAVVCWELLAGRRLFHADSDAAVVARTLEAQVPSLTTVRAGDDALWAVDAVLARCLAVDPRARPTLAQAIELFEAVPGGVASPRAVAAFVAEVAGDLLRARHQVAEDATRLEMAPVPRRRRSSWVLLAAGVLAIGALAWSLRPRPTKPLPLAPAATKQPEVKASQVKASEVKASEVKPRPVRPPSPVTEPPKPPTIAPARRPQSKPAPRRRYDPQDI